MSLNFEAIEFFRNYYSTFRSPKFDPNHWKTEMSPRAIKNIEESVILIFSPLKTRVEEFKGNVYE